jgi:hypothetical protein
MVNSIFLPELVAPCGMNCTICRAYIAYTRGIPRVRGKISYCAGCIPRSKNCYIKRGCKKLTNHQIRSCNECDTMPCKNLTHLDNRYKERYDMSMIENLKKIREKGIIEFLKSQTEKYTCQNCGDVISVHDAKCLGCGYKIKT